MQGIQQKGISIEKALNEKGGQTVAGHERFSRTWFLCFLLLFSGLTAWMLAGCLATPTSSIRDFEIDELLIDLSAFPSGWYVDWSPSYTSDSRDGRFTQFRTHSEGFEARAIHTIHRHRDNQAAAYWYDENQPFGDAERLTPWEIPSELPYETKVANQFRFACADFRQNPDDDSEQFKNCVAIGQYAEYVSIFSISMSPDYLAEHMSYPDLGHVLEVIDERMAHYLGKEGK